MIDDVVSLLLQVGNILFFSYFIISVWLSETIRTVGLILYNEIYVKYSVTYYNIWNI